MGCTIPELIVHIEAQFKPEMSWSNYGEIWQLDHIVPLASFDLTIRDQFLQAVHFTNLQPLSISEHEDKTRSDRAKISEIKKAKTMG